MLRLVKKHNREFIEEQLKKFDRKLNLYSTFKAFPRADAACFPNIFQDKSKLVKTLLSISAAAIACPENHLHQL